MSVLAKKPCTEAGFGQIGHVRVPGTFTRPIRPDSKGSAEKFGRVEELVERI
jgi:hypothetical protein